MKQTTYLPLDISTIFKENFSFPNCALFGSVATIKDNQPGIRTMRIYDFTQDGCPILLTHTQSNKWKEFENNPSVSISLVNETRLVQVIVSGTLNLETGKFSDEKARLYWDKIREDIKKIYSPGYPIGEIYEDFHHLIIPTEVPDTLGIAYLVPSFWETLFLDKEYTKSHRLQFHLNSGSWQKRRIHVG